ncbi:MAG TPA: proton-conducting transporter membrane subunit [Opitutaceae bacterium]
MSPGPLLLVAAGCLAAGVVVAPRLPRTWLGLTLAAAAALLAAAMIVLAGVADWEWHGQVALGGERPHLRVDGVSAWFLALLGVIGGVGAAYAREYWPDHHHRVSAPRGRRWWSLLLLSLVVVLTASNGLHFLLGWELFTVSAFFLVKLGGERREVRAAGWLYLAASHAGTVCLFAFFATLAARTGSWDLGPMRAVVGEDGAALFWLVLAGFGVKAGLFPLHVWLPSAHANAPSHVSAILSGVAVKMGVYGLVRFSGWLPVPPAAGWVVIGLGAAGALLGIAFALAQDDLKRLLAYSSVENIGIILVGLGGGLLAQAQGDAPWGRLALAGALLHVWNHGLFKGLLFLGAGSVLHATGTREISRLGGLWRTMPWTAGLFAVGAAAVAGLPPLNGFVGEWLVYLGLFDAVAGAGPAVWAAVPAALALATAGALALAAFVKAGTLVFMGAPRSAAAEAAHDGGAWMRVPMLLLAAGCFVIGLAPALVWPLLARAIATWNPSWAQAGVAPAPLGTLGGAQVTLAIVALLAAVGLWRRVRHNGVIRSLTWDCGYARPTARMQYTSASFASIAAGWFTWILQPERMLRRPRGTFPATASRVERVPETVLERVIGPVADMMLGISTAVRRLQHGRLQSYLLYLLAGIAAVGALVVWGGAS